MNLRDWEARQLGRQITWPRKRVSGWTRLVVWGTRHEWLLDWALAFALGLAVGSWVVWKWS